MTHDLRKKREASPTKQAEESDLTFQQQIRKVLFYQLDLEILHKWREVQVLQEELERGRQILKSLSMAETVLALSVRGPRPAIQLDIVQAEEAHVVSLMRIDPSEVPHDYFNKHPTQLKQEMDLAMIRANVTGPINDLVKKPMIHVETADPEPVGSGAGLPGSAGDGEAIPTFKGSRYYVKRRIILGNAAKSLVTKSGTVKADPGDADGSSLMENPDGKLPTHKWRVYVKSPKGTIDPSQDVKSFIKAVRFFLHPSYSPNDVIDVTEAPFELLRSGWGEFPIRVQIHFWDPRNKPVEIVHVLRVVTAPSGKYSILAEQAHDLNLDRRTDFQLGSSGLPALLPKMESKIARVSDDDVLLIAVNDFPLAGKRGKRAFDSTKYRPASSMEEFLRLDLDQQRQLEMHRASALCNHLMRVFPTFSMSPENVVSWCREKGYTPASVATFASALEELDLSPEKLLYCRFCGLAHLPQDKFEILQKNCSIRPRKIHVSSRTLSSALISRFELLPENCDIVKRLKQDCFGPYMSYYERSTPANAECNDLEEWTRQKVQDIQPGHPASEPAVKLVTSVVRSFMGKLIEISTKEIPESKERASGRSVLLTPLHVYRAILHRDEMDFLCNAHMLGGAPPKDSAT